MGPCETAVDLNGRTDSGKEAGIQRLEEKIHIDEVCDAILPLDHYP